jgi:DNA primase
MDPNRYNLFITLMLFAQRELCNNEQVIDYLIHTRKLSFTEILNFKIGYIPNTETVLQHLNSAGYSEAFLAREKMFSIVESGKYVFKHMPLCHKLLFPEFYDGMLTGFEIREMHSILFPEREWPLVKYEKVFYDSNRMEESPWYGIEESRKHIIEQDFVIIEEGKFDFLNTRKFNRNVVPIGGTVPSLKKLCELKCYTTRILCAVDSDRPGDRAYEHIKRKASYVGMDLRRVILTPFKDPDLLIRTAPWLWRERVSEALETL